MNVDDLVKNYPRLYHMAEGGSWESIQKHGLLSTSALLDQYGVSGEARKAIEATHRPDCVSLTAPKMGDAVIRDQKPMDDQGLVRALDGSGLKPTDWYRLLNSQVFFWTSKNRLHRLLKAGAYAHLEHDVLTIDTRKLVANYEKSIRLCPMNSGCTKPFPWPRGPDTFLSIADYPWESRVKIKRGEVWDAVVEVCVERSVPDINDFVVSVYRMRGSKPLHPILAPTGSEE
jgi:hypothetical protein